MEPEDTDPSADAPGPEAPPGLEDHRLAAPDGRITAWTEFGVPGDTPLVMFPGSPGCRFAVRWDRSAYEARGLRGLVTERPGYGASSPLPGHGFVEPADDTARILDHRGIARVLAWAGSGGAPYLLAFAERHPERLSAATIVSGSAPLEPAEVDRLIPMNAAFARAVSSGDIDALRSDMATRAEAMLADPLGAFRALMTTAPERDRQVIEDRAWQAELVSIVRESFRPGVDGWLDDVVALRSRWDEIHPESIRTSITWWHGHDDRNVPYAAARRMLERLPNARLRSLAGGHLEARHRNEEILDELIARR